MGRRRTLVQATTDTDVTTVATTLYSVVLATDGTNAVSVDINDGTVASGTTVLTLNAPGVGPATVWTGAGALPDGLGVDVTGTGVVVSVEYGLEEF